MRIVFCIFALLAGIVAARAGEDRQKPLGDVPLMHEEAEAAGLHSVYDGPWEFFVGGGGRGARLRRLGLSLGLSGGRQESGAPVRQQIQGRRVRSNSRRRRSTSAPIRSCSPT